MADNPNQSRSPNVPRAQPLIASLSAVGAIFIAALLGYVYKTEPPIDSQNYEARTTRILQTTPLIDGHNDLPYLIRLELQNQIYDTNRFAFRETLASHTDLQRMKAGRVGGQFWSVFVECPDIENLDDPTKSVRDTIEQIDVAKRFIAEQPEFQYCESVSCAKQAFKKKRIPGMLGAEGLHQTGNSIAVIRQLFNLGVRYITITHNCDNAYAAAASTVTETGKDAGLSEFGKQGIKEMTRLGMMVDLAHVSHQSMREILDVTGSPVIFSHTTCYELAKIHRNAPDDVIAKLPENGGVLMVMFVQRFLNWTHPEAATIKTVVDHIYHVVELASWDNVGIGGDFDGTAVLPEGISSVADYPKLIAAVMARGATDKEVKKLVGENILRVWRQNELNAERLAAEQKPIESFWKGRRWTRWNNPLPVMIPGNPNRITARDYL